MGEMADRQRDLEMMDDDFWHEELAHHRPKQRVYRAPPKDTHPAKVWTMKDGTKVRIADMGDRHLANTLNMLARKSAAEWHQQRMRYEHEVANHPSFQRHPHKSSVKATLARMRGWSLREWLENVMPLLELEAEAQRRGLWLPQIPSKHQPLLDWAHHGFEVIP